MKIAIISFTKNGIKLANQIDETLKGQGFESEADVLSKTIDTSIKTSLSEWTKKKFQQEMRLYLWEQPVLQFEQ